MLVIVSTCGEARLDESIEDHESGKTFCFKGLQKVTEATLLKGNSTPEAISVNDNATSVILAFGI